MYLVRLREAFLSETVKMNHLIVLTANWRIDWYWQTSEMVQ